MLSMVQFMSVLQRPPYCGAITADSVWMGQSRCFSVHLVQNRFLENSSTCLLGHVFIRQRREQGQLPGMDVSS